MIIVVVVVRYSMKRKRTWVYGETEAENQDAISHHSHRHIEPELR